jgi:hypothetical protein
VLSIFGQLLNSGSVNLCEHTVSYFSVVYALGGSPSPTPSQLPFQVQIDYSASDGSRYLKVITRAQPVTTKKVEAESEMNFGIVGAHAARTTASLAAEGKFTQARKSSEESQKLLKKSR